MISILINGQKALVRDIENIGFRYSARENIEELELTTDSLILVNETRKQVIDWIENPTLSGAFVGIPCQIVYGTLTFEYFIDLTERPRINSREIEVKIKKRKGTDAFFDMANGTTFEYLARTGTTFTTIDIPYVIIPDSQVQTGITLVLAVFTMTEATIRAVKETAQLTAEFVASLAGAPALAISAGLKLAAQLAYTIALVIALIDLTQRLRELLFPKVRYFKGVNIKTLLSEALSEIGYSLSSTLLNSLEGLSIMPVPLIKGKKSIFSFIQNDLNESFTNGYPTAQDTVSTIGNTFSALEVALNARTRVKDGVVQFERTDFYAGLSSSTAQPALNIQDKRENQYTYNTDDAWIRYYIHYLTDFSDIHTVDDFEATNAEYGAKNVNQLTPDLNLLKGLRDASIPFALGSRKNNLNWIEEQALALFLIIDALTGLNTSSIIENRIGVVKISQQFYSTTKLLYLSTNNRQPENYLDRIGAKALWNGYHYIEQHQDKAFKEFELAPTPMNFEQFEQLLNNNYIQVNNQPAEVMEFEFLPFKSKATITYRTKTDVMQGKITTFAINE